MAGWFKFYGQDWLMDAKVLQLEPEERLCFITLMCLASSSDDGLVKGYTEAMIRRLSDVDGAEGCLEHFSNIGMITIDNANDNNGCVITIKNWDKRQNSNFTQYERVKRHREKIKGKEGFKNTVTTTDLVPLVINDNAGNVINDNPREEKKREDKNIDTQRHAVEKKPGSKLLGATAERLFEHYCVVTGRKFKFTKDKRELLLKRLSDGFTEDEIKLAMTNFSKDDWEDRQKFMDLKYAIGIIGGRDHLERWVHASPPVLANPGGFNDDILWNYTPQCVPGPSERSTRALILVCSSCVLWSLWWANTHYRIRAWVRSPTISS